MIEIPNQISGKEQITLWSTNIDPKTKQLKIICDMHILIQQTINIIFIYS